MTKKPTVKKGPASSYASPGECIVEVWDPRNKKGCLLSIRTLENGITAIIPYRADPGVVVHMHGKRWKVAR